MRSFFKMFFAAFLAIIAFSVAAFFLFVGMVSALGSKDEVEVPKNSVLMIDLSQDFNERKQKNPLAALTNEETEVPGLYDVVRLIKKAKTDNNISAIYINANLNSNGLAASEEIRNALLDFKTKKLIVAHGDVMSQSAYYVANVAHHVYANPVGVVDWRGFNVSLAFLKGTLDKLKIEPQIFYAGKFKSATEPFRTQQMTPENKVQTREWLGDLYSYFLLKTSEARGIDTATLHALANQFAIKDPQDALRYRLIDGVKYEDEVRDELRQRMKLDKEAKINTISILKYAEAGKFKKTGSSRIAVIYAEGDIIDGKGDKSNIASEDYVKMIRKVRLDKSIKAVVFRINSGGGSALASENIWRELTITKKEKPVIVSFGDVAASGGYYIGSAGDSIFCQPNTITGSIGVFGIVPNMKGFFNDKLGVTFDGVSTAPYADMPTITRPLTEAEKQIIQQSVDKIYLQFKQRVAQGRNMNINYVDSIAQGRVWSGVDALRLGLVDRLGGLEDAIESAARMAKVSDYRLREYPEVGSWLEELLGKSSSESTMKLKEQVGEENFRIYQEMVKLKQICGPAQARLPFTFFIY